MTDQEKIKDLEEKLDKCLKGLKQIESHKGNTLLGTCCSDEACAPYFEGDSRMDCSYRYGVNTGFDQCASIATQVLEDVESPKEKGVDA